MIYYFTKIPCCSYIRIAYLRSIIDGSYGRTETAQSTQRSFEPKAQTSPLVERASSLQKPGMAKWGLGTPKKSVFAIDQSTVLDQLSSKGTSTVERSFKSGPDTPTRSGQTKNWTEFRYL